MIYEEVSIYRQSDSAILKQAEAGTSVADLCREYGMSSASFYQWRSKYGGMDASLMRRLKGARSRERAAQEDVCRRADQVRVAAGSP